MTDFSSPLPSLQRKIPPFEDFLKNISQESQAGPSLRYDLIYDEIRVARQEDDPRLSMGIWQTDLKRADWNKIERLCIEALTAKSKDLQIAAWLAEAWTSLDGIEGYTRGIQLFFELTETFWKAIHPLPQEDDDIENRLMILEWMDTTLSSRLLSIPLTQSKFDQTAFGLGFFKSVQYSDASQKRVPSSSPDPSKGIGTTEEFQKSLDQTPKTYLLKVQQNIAEALQATQSLKDALSTLLGAASPSFSKILGTLKEMERIIRKTLQARQPPPPVEKPAPEPINPDMPALEDEEPGLNGLSDLPEISSLRAPDLQTRDDAYRQLETIAAFLEESDPHSLAPQLLRQLIRWENKNIVDIFEEIAKTPQEYDILMKILGHDRSIM